MFLCYKFYSEPTKSFNTMTEEHGSQDSQTDKDRNPDQSSSDPLPKLPNDGRGQVGTPKGADEIPSPKRLLVEIVKDDTLTTFEKRMFWLTLGGVILALVTGYIFYRQFREMSTQTGILSQQAKTAHDDSVDAGRKADAQIVALHGQVATAQEAVKLAAKDSAQNAVRVEKQLKLLQSQAEANRDQADAALKSAIAIQKQTDISERPWLSVEATPVNGLTFVNGQQAVLVLKLSIKNVGKSVAKDVQADAKLLPTPVGIPLALDAAQKQRELCDNPKVDPVGRFDIFPGDHSTERELDISSIPPASIIQSVTNPGEKPRSFVGFYVVGCISYHSSFGMEMHQTRFGYHLVGPPIISPDGKGFLMLSNGQPLMMGFEMGVNVPEDKVGFWHELFSRNDAN
jgi:hypothetical protein